VWSGWSGWSKLGGAERAPFSRVGRGRFKPGSVGWSFRPNDLAQSTLPRSIEIALGLRIQKFGNFTNMSTSR
jgi:hypothetical protein